MIVATLPDGTPQELAPLLERLTRAPRPAPERSLEMLAALSRRILAAPDLARQGEAAALGFWLRPASLNAILNTVQVPPRDGLRVPAGLAFHLPPANVDAMFVHGWALSLLAGNANVTRLSGRRGPLAARLLELIGETLAAYPDIAAGNAFIAYGHDDAITAALSAACDLRVVWGGDASIAAIRAVPLSPQAREIAFADRLSAMVLAAEAVAALDADGLARLAGALFNDIYSFGQMACASPRLLVWLGDAATAATAEARLSAAMAAEFARRGFHVEPGVAINKYGFACAAALDGVARGVRFATTDWMLLDLGDGAPATVPRGHCGGGLLYRCRLDALEALIPAIDRSWQTLTHFGVPRAALWDFATRLGGRGIDRLVPVGQALEFGPHWDGHDLLAEMTRLVVVRG